jgi:hypothetical protein
MGVRGEGPPPQTLAIKNNTFSMGAGWGIMVTSYGVDGSTITGNKITGSGTHAIYVGSPKKPNTGKYVIEANTVTGYRSDLFIDPALQTGTVLTNEE